MLFKGPQVPSRAARAHALKNCLAIVSAVNELVEPELGESARQRLSRSQAAVERMHALIEEDLVPNDESVQPRRAEPVAAAHVLGAVGARVWDLAEARGVRLSFQVGSGNVSGDARELVEALGNIVVNAIESSPSGAIVFVTSAQSSDGRLLWSVRDEGPGIPGHVLARIGTPFFSRRQGGSGLGLAVAHETIDRHGGHIDIESVPGLGTFVSIQLPRQLAENAGTDRTHAARLTLSAGDDVTFSEESADVEAS
jgi:signal transduction histidine kinase